MPAPFARSLLKPNSMSFRKPSLRTYPPRLPPLELGQALLPPRLRVDEPKSLERERKLRNSGRKVAIAAAVIPIPGSTVLQMATSVVEYRKSSWASCLMYGMRTIVAVEPLFIVRNVSVARWQALHCTKCQNQCHGNLGSRIHSKIPDEEDWENAQCPVR